MSDITGKILRVSRIVIGIAVWAVATWILVSYGMTFPVVARWIEKIQFLQAAMAFSISTVVVWLIATLVFGRIYCSVACPLGVFQDICARLPRLGRYPSRRNYHYSPPLTRWRNISLACVVASIFLGITVASTFLIHGASTAEHATICSNQCGATSSIYSPIPLSRSPLLQS